MWQPPSSRGVPRDAVEIDPLIYSMASVCIRASVRLAEVKVAINDAGHFLRQNMGNTTS